MRDVLRLRVYRRLLGAYALNELAWAFGTLSLALLVYRRTHSSLATAGFYLCAQFVPALIAPLLVVRIDQFSMRRVLPALYASEAVAFAAFSWISGSFVLIALLAVALLDGTAAVAARGLARAASAAVLAPAELVREGNAVTNLTFSLTYLGGPALAGLLIATGGTRDALILAAVLFAAISANLVTTRSLPAAPPHRARSRGRLKAAWGYVRREPVIRSVLTVQFIAIASFTIATPVEVIYAVHSLHAKSTGYGLILTSWGAGTVLGSALFARTKHRPPRELIAASAAVLAVGFGVMAAAPVLVVGMLGALLCGIGNGVEVIAARTAFQEAITEDLLTIVLSLYESVVTIAPGLGILLGGALAAIGSPRIALTVAGVGAVAAGAAAWLGISVRQAPGEPPGAGTHPGLTMLTGGAGETAGDAVPEADEPKADPAAAWSVA